MTMTLASSTLQIRRHEYSGDLDIVILVIFVGIGTLPFYAINMDVVSLFTDSSFLFLANLDLYFIDVLYQFKWMNIVYFCKKINNIHVFYSKSYLHIGYVKDQYFTFSNSKFMNYALLPTSFARAQLKCRK